MAFEPTLIGVKSIVKTVGKSVDLKIKSGTIFVEKGASIAGGKNRHCFFISKGGHGVGKWATGMAANWLSNVAQGAAGVGATGLGALGGGLAGIAGKGSGLSGLAGAQKDGLIRDAKEIEKIAGAGNLIHMLKANDAVVYFGTLDTWGDNNWGMWGGLGNDDASWKFYLRQIKDARVADLGYHFSGTYDKATKKLTVNGKEVKLASAS